MHDISSMDRIHFQRQDYWQNDFGIESGWRRWVKTYIMRWIFFIVEIPTGFALIAVLFNKNNQRMGDMAGGTYVVKTRNAYFGKAMNKQNFPPGYQPVYPQVEKLSQAQIDLISEMYYLNNKNSEWARTQLCKKICNYLNINVTGVSTRNFLSQLTYDFKFITAQQE